MASFRSRQQGVVMLIALTVLVAMSLAGVALIRSVDTAALISGNLSFKTAGLQAADRGTQQALSWLMTTRDANVNQLYNNITTQGYFASRPIPDPDWFDQDNWIDSVAVNGGLTDIAGNKMSYVIHRMCTYAGSAPGDTVAGNLNECPSYYPSKNKNQIEGQTRQVGGVKYEFSAQTYYRITTRVVGPRNNITITQTTVLM